VNNYTIGSTVTIHVTLLRNGVPEDITGYAIKGALVCRDMSTLAKGTEIIDGVILDAKAGNVRLQFPKKTTDKIVPGDYWVEVQATVDDVSTTYDRVQVRLLKGAIK